MLHTVVDLDVTSIAQRSCEFQQFSLFCIGVVVDLYN